MACPGAVYFLYNARYSARPFYPKRLRLTTSNKSKGRLKLKNLKNDPECGAVKVTIQTHSFGAVLIGSTSNRRQRSRPLTGNATA